MFFYLELYSTAFFLRSTAELTQAFFSARQPPDVQMHLLQSESEEDEMDSILVLSTQMGC